MTSRPHRPYARIATSLLVVATVIAGCGSDDEPSTEASTAPSTTAGDGEVVATDAPATDDGSEASGFPATIEHKYGSTTVEAEPERVAVVGLTEQDALLALGVVPVATTEWFGAYPGSVWPWAQDELEALGGTDGSGAPPAELGASETNFEAVAAQDPDLIVAVYSGLTQEDYDTLSAIAPTIAQPAEYVDWGVPWDVLTRTVGTAIGKADEAEALIADIEAQFAAAREAHPEFDGATGAMATPYEGLFVYSPQDVRGRFMTDLGFELPADLGELAGDDFGAELSPEQADYLDLDVVVWLDAEAAMDSSQADLYKALPVHTEAREVHLSSDGTDVLGGATSFVTVLSLPYLIDGLVPLIATAIDGDPSTVVER